MASPFNCSISSFVLNDLNNSNDSDDEDFDERDHFNEFEDPSEFSITEDIIESDYEDYPHERSGDGDSVIYVNDTSENPFEVDLDHDLEDNCHDKDKKNSKPDQAADDSDVESVDSSQKCPICLGAWTTTGKHRLCSLRCGHIFGYSCIKQWLKSDNEHAERCPQCNARASIKHIRVLYANKVISSDSTELENMQKQMEKCKKKYYQMKKALADQKKRTRKYKKMYRSTKMASAISDYCLSD